jgi:hypothetical protein
MMSARRIRTPAQALERKRRIMRIELSTCVGCALTGAVFLTGGHTLREMSIFLFGWSAGCAFHLTQTMVAGRLARRHPPGSE